MLKVINEITDDIDIRMVEKISDYSSVSSLHNNLLKEGTKTTKDIFTETLLRDLLIRSPIVEFEFRQISNNGFILCLHKMITCNCRIIANIKNIISLAGTYENGLRALSHILFPNMDVHYKREKYTHINISPNSFTQEGSELWSFLTDKFRLPTLLESVSIMDLVNANLTITKDISSDFSHVSELANIIENMVRCNSDIQNLLIYNQLPFSMYETVYVRNIPTLKIDIYNAWIPMLFNSISNKIKEERGMPVYIDV